MFQCNSVKKNLWTNVSLFLTTFLIPFYIFRFKVFGIPTNVFEIGVLLLLITTIAQYSRYKIQDTNKFQIQNINNQICKLNIGNWGLSVSCFLFLVSCFLGVWRAGWSTESLGIFKSWVVVPMVFGGVICYWQEKGRREKEKAHNNTFNQPLLPLAFNLSPIFLGLYTSMLVVSVWAILQKIGLISTLFYQATDTSFAQYLGNGFRAFGPFESPNYLAMFIVPTALLAVGTNLKFKISNSKFWKGAFYLSLVLPLLALYFSQSRAGWIAMVGAISVIGVIWLYRRLKSSTWQILLLISALILYSVFYILLFKYGLRGTDTIRLQIYQYSWQMLKENWLFGLGAGNFQQTLAQMPLSDSFRQNALSYAYHPHNLYLALWLNFGILGLVSFIGLVAVFFRKVLTRPGNLWLLAAMAAILIHGILDTTFFKNDLAVIFWLIISFAYATENNQDTITPTSLAESASYHPSRKATGRHSEGAGNNQ